MNPRILTADQGELLLTRISPFFFVTHMLHGAGICTPTHQHLPEQNHPVPAPWSIWIIAKTPNTKHSLEEFVLGVW